MKARLKHYIYIYTIHGAIDGHVCFYRRSFSDPAKLRRPTAGCMGPLRGTNKATWYVRLLPTTVSAYHVDCGCFCALLGTRCCYLSPCGWYDPPTHPPLYTLSVILQQLEKTLKTQQCQLGGRISYNTIAT